VRLSHSTYLIWDFRNHKFDWWFSGYTTDISVVTLATLRHHLHSACVSSKREQFSKNEFLVWKGEGDEMGEARVPADLRCWRPDEVVNNDVGHVMHKRFLLRIQGAGVLLPQILWKPRSNAFCFYSGGTSLKPRLSYRLSCDFIKSPHMKAMIKKSRGLSLRAKYTDRAAAACRRS
jgi:hypothetical protein